MFDLQGYVILRQAISDEDVAHMNRSIDKHEDQFVERQETIRNTSVDTFKGKQESYVGRYEHGMLNACKAYFGFNQFPDCMHYCLLTHRTILRSLATRRC